MSQDAVADPNWMKITGLPSRIEVDDVVPRTHNHERRHLVARWLTLSGWACRRIRLLWPPGRESQDQRLKML